MKMKREVSGGQMRCRVALVIVVSGCLVGGIVSLLWVFLKGDGSNWSVKSDSCVGPHCHNGSRILMSASIQQVKRKVNRNVAVLDYPDAPNVYSCDCTGEPPRLPPPLYHQWDGRPQPVGNSVVYTCALDALNEIAAVAECTDRCVWEIVLLRPCTQPISDCLDDPPVMSNNYLEWDYQTRAVGTLLHYKCSKDRKAPTVQIVRCSKHLKWEFLLPGNFEELFNKQCECFSEPPNAPWPIIVQKGGNVMGQKRRYMCSAVSSSPVVRSVLCDNNLRWTFDTNNASWAQLMKKHCECLDAPPPISEPGIHRIWKNISTYYNAVIEDKCYRNPHSPVFRVIRCNETLQWDVEMLNDCECTTNPPEAEFFAHSDWNGVSRKMGVMVRHYCHRNDHIGNVKRIFTCNYGGIWELVKEFSCACNEEPPSPPWPIVREWNDNNTQTYTMVNYRCSNDQQSPSVQTAVCNFHGQWKMLPPMSFRLLTELYCECNQDPPLPELPSVYNWDHSRAVGTVITYRCLQDESYGWKMRVKCSTDRQWRIEAISSCECPLEPPLPVFGAFREWNENRYVNSTAMYKCSASDITSIQVITCNRQRDWVPMFQESLESLVQQHCKCPYPPPIPPYPVFMDWKNHSRKINTTVEYKCTSDIDSPVIQVAYCAHGRQWKLANSGNFSTLMSIHCECQGNPPRAPSTAMDDWNESSRYIGSLITHYCLKTRAAGWSSIWKCTRSLRWELAHSGSCECQHPPPVAPFPMVMDWNPNISYFVNTSFSYHCSQEPDAIPVQKAVCNYQKKWELMKSNNFFQLFQTVCVCLDEPPPGLNLVHVIWEDRRRLVGSRVNYFCNNPELTGVIALSARCSGDGTWKLDSNASWNLTISKNCECPPPPSVSSPNIHMEWVGPALRLGSSVIYRCTNSGTQQRRLRCTDAKMWVAVGATVTCQPPLSSSSFSSSTTTTSSLGKSCPPGWNGTCSLVPISVLLESPKESPTMEKIAPTDNENIVVLEVGANSNGNRNESSRVWQKLAKFPKSSSSNVISDVVVSLDQKKSNPSQDNRSKESTSQRPPATKRRRSWIEPNGRRLDHSYILDRVGYIKKHHDHNRWTNRIAVSEYLKTKVDPAENTNSSKNGTSQEIDKELLVTAFTVHETPRNGSIQNITGLKDFLLTTSTVYETSRNGSIQNITGLKDFLLTASTVYETPRNGSIQNIIGQNDDDSVTGYESTVTLNDGNSPPVSRVYQLLHTVNGEVLSKSTATTLESKQNEHSEEVAVVNDSGILLNVLPEDSSRESYDDLLFVVPTPQVKPGLDAAKDSTSGNETNLNKSFSLRQWQWKTQDEKNSGTKTNFISLSGPEPNDHQKQTKVSSEESPTGHDGPHQAKLRTQNGVKSSQLIANWLLLLTVPIAVAL